MSYFLKFLIYSALVVMACGGVTAGICIYLYKYRMTRGDPSIEVYRVDCKSCTGGTQALVKGEWGPIPMDMRMVQDGVRTFEPPLGNTRSCRSCNGRGWFPVDK